MKGKHIAKKMLALMLSAALILEMGATEVSASQNDETGEIAAETAVGGI